MGREHPEICPEITRQEVCIVQACIELMYIHILCDRSVRNITYSIISLLLTVAAPYNLWDVKSDRIFQGLPIFDLISDFGHQQQLISGLDHLHTLSLNAAHNFL